MALGTKPLVYKDKDTGATQVRPIWGYSNTDVQDDINKGTKAEQELGSNAVKRAYDDIIFSPEWLKNTWNKYKGDKSAAGIAKNIGNKAGVIVATLGDAIAGFRGMNFNQGHNSAGVGSQLGEQIKNRNEDLRTVGQQAAEDAMTQQNSANANAARRNETTNEINQKLGYTTGKDAIDSADVLKSYNYNQLMGDPSIAGLLQMLLVNSGFDLQEYLTGKKGESKGGSESVVTDKGATTPTQQVPEKPVATASQTAETAMSSEKNKGVTSNQPRKWNLLPENQLMSNQLDEAIDRIVKANNGIEVSEETMYKELKKITKEQNWKFTKDQLKDFAKKYRQALATPFEE